MLHLNYDTNLPLYKVVEYHEDTRSEVDANYDIRYIVKIFPAGDSREELFHYEFFKDDISELNNDVTIMLKEGKYRFVVWTDYVSAGEASLYSQSIQWRFEIGKGNDYPNLPDSIMSFLSIRKQMLRRQRLCRNKCLEPRLSI